MMVMSRPIVPIEYVKLAVVVMSATIMVYVAAVNVCASQVGLETDAKCTNVRQLKIALE
jgi:hypothetical protein|tara:strand:- start:379 stop:555 length:177 start_codon:yes stop_codon:yes gene_type:complete